MLDLDLDPRRIHFAAGPSWLNHDSAAPEAGSPCLWTQLGQDPTQDRPSKTLKVMKLYKDTQKALITTIALHFDTLFCFMISKFSNKALNDDLSLS